MFSFFNRVRTVSEIEARFDSDDNLGLRGEVEIEARSDGSYVVEAELEGVARVAPVAIRVSGGVLLEAHPRFGRIDAEVRIPAERAPSGMGPGLIVTVEQDGVTLAEAEFRLEAR